MPHRRRRAAAAICLGFGALGCGPSHSPEAAPVAPARITPVIDSIANAALREHALPGLSVAVLRGGDLLLAKGYGLADLEHAAPAGPGTVYQIGSISKQFTAAAVMRLVEQGKVGFEEPLRRWLPDYPAPGRDVRVRQLLSHTAGIREFFTIPGFAEMETTPAAEVSRADLVAFFSREPLHFAPGERWAYSNSNYTLLGLVIERAGGKDYADFLREELLAPLGLESTHSCDRRPAEPAPARGYVMGGEGRPVPAPEMNLNTAVGDGGVCSTAVDLVRWARALARGGVVAPRSYARMTTPEPVRLHPALPYGFGLSLVPLDGVPKVAHSGRTIGYTGALAYYPEHDVSVAVLTNRGGVPIEALERAVARAVLGLPAPAGGSLPLGDAERRAYAGIYDIGVFPIEVVDLGDGLELRVPSPGPPPSRLSFRGDHLFAAELAPDAIQVRFRLRDGRAESLVLEMGGMHWYGARRS